MFYCVCCVAAVDDHGGRAGAKRCKIAQKRRSVAPREALVVLYRAMRAELHRRIRMVFEIAGKPSVFFSLSTRHISNIVTILKLIYCFKQNQATAPLRSPSGGSPTC